MSQLLIGQRPRQVVDLPTGGLHIQRSDGSGAFGQDGPTWTTSDPSSWLNFTRRNEGKYSTTYESALRAYREVSTFRSCVDLVADLASEVPIKLMEPDDSEQDTYEQIHDSVITMILERANDTIAGLPHLIYQTVNDLYLGGISYWQLVPSSLVQATAEIYRRRPDQVEPIPDPDDYVSGYKLHRRPGVRTSDFTTIPPDEMIVFMIPNPESIYYGLSRFHTTSRNVTSDSLAVSYNNQFFEENARPDGILSTEHDLSRSEAAQIRDTWQSRFKARPHKTAVLPLGLKYEAIAQGPKDADFGLLKQMSREDICAMMRVHPILLGYHLDEITPALMLESRRLLYEQNIRPLLNRIAVALTRKYLPTFSPLLLGNGWKLQFDFSNIPGLVESEDKKREGVRQLVHQGIITPNEARAQLGYKGTVPWGDTWMMPNTYAPVDQVQKAAAQGLQLPNTQTPDDETNTEEDNDNDE